MQTRELGKHGPAVGALGLGAMGMSGAYGEADRSESIATVHAALDAGTTLIDTGDFYAMGHNELLLAEALQGRDRDSYQLSVKFGMLGQPGGGIGGIEGRPALVKTFRTMGEDFSATGWVGQLMTKVHKAGSTNFVALGANPSDSAASRSENRLED